MKQVLDKIWLFIFFGVILLFFKESLFWFYKVLIGLHDLFNTVLFVLLLFFIFKKNSLKIEYFRFNYKLPPLVICLLSVTGYYLLEKYIQINILSFIVFLIYVFGFLGFYISNYRWKKLLIPFGLVLLVLPFGNLLDLYIGFPLRIASVNLVSVFFEFIGIDYLSTDTIITIENNSSQVDFSCSGIKGLWAALIFYLTNTWLKRYKVGFNWLSIGLILMLLILVLNTLRILILVYFDLVLKLPKISDIIHVPLGIFGFVFSCTVTYFLSDYFLELKEEDLFVNSSGNLNKSFNKWFLILPLIQIGFCLNMREQSLPKIKENNDYFNSLHINNWDFEKSNLSNQEVSFIENQGGQLEKFTFSNGALKGNGFILKSKTWRSHHNPEYCITSRGEKIVKSETLMIDNENSIKNIVLKNGQQGYYWFQSKSYITDDFGTRVWKEIFYGKKDWFLVCVIFNPNKKPDQKYIFVKQVIQHLNTKQ